MSFIRGRIVKIINKYTVVLNVGKEKNVTPGTRFLIYADTDEITDPVTKKKLGKLEIPKGEVVASLVQEKYSVAETDLEGSTPLAEALATWGSLTSSYEGHKKLDVDEKNITPLPQDVFEVKIGDPVRSIERT